MGQNARILIVDDNTDYLFTMETFLKRSGFETVTAEDGKKGLDLIGKDRPDLILLDIMMEGLFSGFQVIKKLREDPNLKDIPVIGVSGMGDELGVDTEKYRLVKRYFSPETFFQKPVDKEKLLSKIKELLGQ